MEPLDGVIQSYDWGSVSALPELLGIEPSGDPQAELWFGAHPRGTAQIGGRSLIEVIAADPGGELGAGRVALPFLAKLLAAAHPLSIQTHPDRFQAASGFAAEELAGVPIDADERTYRDPSPKPELICALTPFDVLCGFRDPHEAAAVIAGWEVDELGPLVQLLEDDGTASERSRAALTWLLGLAPERAAAVVAEVTATGDQLATLLADRHPGDIGVVVAHLLNRVTLAPGEALFLAAGDLHSYLGGVGVELMANSDNVVRCGLTTKHVDRATLLTLVDTEPRRPTVQRPTGSVHRYATSVDEFALIRVDHTSTSLVLSGPVVAIVTEGTAELTAEGVGMDVPRGQAVWVPARAGHLSIAADDAQVHLATTGNGAVR